jgi:hypothetical protein
MRSRQPPASNFLAARDFAFAALLFYANITPAALHRGDLDDRDRESAEAAGRNAKFEPSDPRPSPRTWLRRPRKCPRWHQVEQRVPDA